MIDTLFSDHLESALNRVFKDAEEAIKDGVNLLILSDRNMNEDQVAIPTLLAVSGLHQELIRQGIVRR